VVNDGFEQEMGTGVLLGSARVLEAARSLGDTHHYGHGLKG